MEGLLQGYNVISYVFFGSFFCGKSRFLVNCVISYVIYNINGDRFFYMDWKIGFRDLVVVIRGVVYGGCGKGFGNVWCIY